MSTEASSLSLMDDALIRVNVSRTHGEIAIACVRSDRRHGPDLFVPVMLAIGDDDGGTGLPASTGLPRARPASAHMLCAALSLLLSKALAHGYTGHDPFVRHMTLALYVMCRRDADREPQLAQTVRGGLKPWQKQLAAQMLGDSEASASALQDAARSCGLSAAHFCRAFTKSFGLPPYRWALGRRLEKARSLLADRTRSLADIAYECGFCDQSHFSHAFSRQFGVSPGAWRQGRRPAAEAARARRPRMDAVA